MNYKYILIVCLLILITIFYNISEKYDTNECDKNCGNYNNSNGKLDNKKEINNCLKCDECGVYTLEDNSKSCTNGTREGPLFIKNYIKWTYGKENIEKIPDIEVNNIETNDNNILIKMDQQVKEDKKEINKLIIPSPTLLVNKNRDKELDELIKFLTNKI